MKKKYLLALATYALLNVVHAQEIITISTGASFKKLKSKEKIEYLDHLYDTTQAQFVALIKVTDQKCPCLLEIHNKLLHEARKKGANAFKAVSYDYGTSLTVSLFHLTKAEQERNVALKPTNTIYVFAGEDDHTIEYFNFDLNGNGQILKKGHFITYPMKEGEQVKLKSRSLLGTLKWVKWKPHQRPTYLSLEDFYKAPVVKHTTVNSSKVGDFKPVERTLGEMLIHLLSPMQE